MFSLRNKLIMQHKVKNAKHQARQNLQRNNVARKVEGFVSRNSLPFNCRGKNMNCEHVQYELKHVFTAWFKHVQRCRLCSILLPKSRVEMPREYPGHWSYARHFRQFLPSCNRHQSNDVSPVKYQTYESPVHTKPEKNWKKKKTALLLRLGIPSTPTRQISPGYCGRETFDTFSEWHSGVLSN